MVCPDCGEELQYHDYFGRICKHQDGTIIGDIYQCVNEVCSGYQQYFHTLRSEGSEELHEGYPC